jgi:hypothetical protein
VGYDAGGCNGELDMRCHGISVRTVSGGDTGYGRRDRGKERHEQIGEMERKE